MPWPWEVKIIEKVEFKTKVTNKVAKILGEYESIIDVYERNDFKVKSKIDNKTILFKKLEQKNGEHLNLLL